MNNPIQRVWLIAVIVAILAALMTWTLVPDVANIPLVHKDSSSWYYWQNPEPSQLTRLTAWGGYILNQLFIWGAIYWAVKHKDKVSNWGKLHPINYVILGGTAFFILLHYLQTKYFFDGLAIDVPVWTALGSVVFMLVILLLMEAPRRGLFFGVGQPWFKSIQPFLYRIHGFYIAWAITYTFWYHPMYPTWGHVTGFFYMYLIFVQQGLIFTRMHVNPYWTVVIETAVVIHGVTISLINVPDMWAMFGYGFLGMFVTTQMFGLKLTKAGMIIIAGMYLAAVIMTYYFLGWNRINEVIRIPIIEYLVAFVLGGLLIWIIGRRAPKTA